MLAFADQFNNDDPLANPEELAALYTNTATFFLVLGNLFGIFPFLYAWRIGLYFLAASILWSVIVSCFYHLCQTTHECFQLILPKHVSSDHFTAISMAGLVILALANVLTVCELLTKKRVIKTARQSNTTDAARPCRRGACEVINRISTQPEYVCADLEPDVCECGEEMRKHITYGRIGENMIYDAWTSVSTLTVLVVTVLSVEAHPFSYAAINIVITVALIAAWIKILLIDEGEPTNLGGRISKPELIISLILSIIGLAAYVSDSYIEYMALHTIWHIAIYLGLMFFLAGTMKSVNGWVPLWGPACYWLKVFCHGYDE